MVRTTVGDRGFAAQAGLALVQANGRYWSSVAPTVRKQIRRWERRAQAIDDPELRALALAKLHGESFHAEAAAMLATLAPREHRATVVEAIVALELLFDYLDGLTELPSRDPLREGDRLFSELIDAVTVPVAVTREFFEKPLGDEGTGKSLEQPMSSDGGYLEALSRAVSVALAQLPAAQAITEVAQRVASRAGEAQTRMHAAGRLGVAQVEEWARAETNGTGLQWRELVAGAASSVLVLHALIAAAADPQTTLGDAERIAEAYLSTCVLLTLLDGLVDYEEDGSRNGSGGLGYLSLFEDRDELVGVLGEGARRAAVQARALPNGPHHLMTLTGVVAYYGSAPGARGDMARPMVARLRRELQPLISPTLLLVRAWRSTRRRKTANGARPNEQS